MNIFQLCCYTVKSTSPCWILFFWRGIKFKPPTNELIQQYDAVVIEDLNMKEMSQALHFGKSVADNAWGMFTTFLQYKLKDKGRSS
jgi:hypothetical protein